MNFKKQMTDGLFTNNPIFVQFLGMCSALAITTSVTNAIGMGLSVTAVLICSNVIISLLRKFIVPQVRIAAFIVVISGFVTVVELVMKAYLPDLNKSLGLFIPLIVVNCIILARAESFASKNGVAASAVDGLWQGLGYTLAVVVTSVVRELLGTGKLFAASDGSGGITILGSWYQPANIFILPPGAFLTLAFLVAGFHALIRRAKNKDVRKKLAEEKARLISDGEAFGAEAPKKDEKKSDKAKDPKIIKEQAQKNDAKKVEKAPAEKKKDEGAKGAKAANGEKSAEKPEKPEKKDKNADNAHAENKKTDKKSKPEEEGAFEFLPYGEVESKQEFDAAVQRFSAETSAAKNEGVQKRGGALADLLNAALTGAVDEKEAEAWRFEENSGEDDNNG